MVSRVILGFGTVALLALSAETTVAFADEPKPTPDNTIHVELTEPVKPQAFARPLKFSLTDTTDRSGNAQPMLVYKPRNGIFLDRTPVEIRREALSHCLKYADMSATDTEAAGEILAAS